MNKVNWFYYAKIIFVEYRNQAELPKAIDILYKNGLAIRLAMKNTIYYSREVSAPKPHAFFLDFCSPEEVIQQRFLPCYFPFCTCSAVGDKAWLDASLFIWCIWRDFGFFKDKRTITITTTKKAFRGAKKVRAWSDAFDVTFQSSIGRPPKPKPKPAFCPF